MNGPGLKTLLNTSNNLLTKLENSHKYAATNLSISLSIFLSILLPQQLCPIYTKLGRLAVIALHQNSMNTSPLQLGNIDALEIGNRILLEIEFESCMPLQN